MVDSDRIAHLLIITIFSFVVVPTVALTTPIENSNIGKAVSLWLENKEQAASVYGGDISDWNTSAITDMSSMFYRANLFNGILSGWDTSAVTDMKYMFIAPIPSTVICLDGKPPPSRT
eukprot:scaffold37301_cov47-Attheya_sp.AAC.2